MQSHRKSEKRLEIVCFCLRFVYKQTGRQTTQNHWKPLWYIAQLLFLHCQRFIWGFWPKNVKKSPNKASSLLFRNSHIHKYEAHMCVLFLCLIASRSSVLGSKDSHSCARYFNLPAMRPWMDRFFSRADPPASTHLPKSKMGIFGAYGSHRVA